MAVTTPLKDVALGSTVFHGFMFAPEDVNPKASAKSKSRSQSGKGKHICIVVGKVDNGVLVAGSATFGSKFHQLAEIFPKESLKYWMPVSPATREMGMAHAPAERITIKDDPPQAVWINLRKLQIIEAEEFIIAEDAYSLATVNDIRAAMKLETFPEA